MSFLQTLKHSAFRVAAGVDDTLHPSRYALAEIRSFVLLQYPSALGSAVHATPLIRALRAAVPDAEITVCACGFALAILSGNPGVDRLIATPDPTRQPLPAAAAIRRALPARPFATLFSTFNERSSIAVAALLAGARNRVGFTLVPEVFRAPIAYDPALSQIANNLRIVAALGHAAAGAFEPQVFFSAADLAYACDLLAGFKDFARPLAALVTQTSPTQRKSWRAARFVAAAQHLIAKHDAKVILVGASSERPAVESITQSINESNAGRALNLAGETNLPQLAALLSLCRVGVTLDTGTMHIGRAVGLPMVIIAPAWSPPVEWLPLNDPRFRILKNLDLASAPPDYMIDEVSVGEVAAGLDALLAAEYRRT